MSTGLQQRLTLPPAPDSARAARRFVGEVLASARAEAFSDTAALLTSELVTNGIVHANTDLQILVEATPRWVRVEVFDGNPALPSRRDYDEHAATGRGLEMVELLAAECGVQAVEGGKLVWFRLGVAPGTPEPAGPGSSDGPAAATVRVTLLSLPVALYCAWQQHADALLREATLVALREYDADDHKDYPLAARALSALAEAATSVFELRDEDVPSADVELDIVADAVQCFPILRDLLSRATELSEGGGVLVPPALPEIVALRNWIANEVARQSAGLAPTAWTDGDLDAVEPAPVPLATLDAVRHSDLALVAADASNRVVAVSRSAADLLGWDAEDLEGRRLVALIPPRLRNRHVAGFTRNLLDGSTRILGAEVVMPALRHDGTEIAVSLRIERRAEPATRALYVATLSAVD